MTDDWEDMFASAARQLGPRENVVLTAVKTACDTATPASLMAAHMALSCTGHLRAASSSGVVIELPHPPKDPLQGSMVAISYPVAGKATGFTSRVTAVHARDDGSIGVVVALPERIQTGTRRASVRVPVPPGTLSAAILRGEDPHPVEAIDLSMRGILIEFRQGEVPDIEEGHRRMVALKLGDRSVMLEAEVRRRDGPRYGMLFIIRDERPLVLVKIISELQYRWSTT